MREPSSSARGRLLTSWVSLRVGSMRRQGRVAYPTFASAAMCGSGGKRSSDGSKIGNAAQPVSDRLVGNPRVFGDEQVESKRGTGAGTTEILDFRSARSENGSSKSAPAA